MIKELCLVGIGGALGCMCRYGLTLVTAHFLMGAEKATLAANILGSFLIGLAMSGAKGGVYLFCAVGFCGGFTTFSTFSAQSMHLLQEGRYAAGLLYMLASVLLSLASVWAGCLCGQKIYM